jgi:DNA-binding transcriptional MerR regulator
MKNIYLVKDLAAETGYSSHTIKYYLRMGLFEEIGRGPSTRFRYFDDSTVATLRKIRRMRHQGMSLKTIKDNLS